jgi:K+-sensing histidine kinase KdpD
MSLSDVKKPRVGTDRLDTDDLAAQQIIEQQIEFRPIPYTGPQVEGVQRPVWRVRLDVSGETPASLGLDINGEVIIGRGSERPNLLDLSAYKAAEQGISRRHCMLRPTPTALYLIDLGSTNGTLRNGQSIGVNTPYGLVNGDVLTLGRLQMTVRIIDRPSGRTASLEKKADLADALAEVAKAITSQLELDEVLNRVAEAAMSVTSARATGIWLVDEQSGELFLEAQRGIEDERIQRMRLSITGDSLVSQVIRTGQPLRASSKPGEDKIKVKTGYLVGALIFMPLTLGGVTFGVLSATHEDPKQPFGERDERLLSAIADFAAIAVQNARTYQLADRALTERVEELASLNDLSTSLAASLQLEVVNRVMVQKLCTQKDIEDALLWMVDSQTSLAALYDKSADAREKVRRTGNQFTNVVQRVMETKRPVVVPFIDMAPEFRKAEGISTSEMKASSVVALPLMIKGNLAGVLSLVTKHGTVRKEDLDRLQRLTNPVVAAIENAQLYAESERTRATVYATANTLQQPLIILDHHGKVLVSNAASKDLVENHMGELFEGLSEGVGRTTELTIGDNIYLTTAEHVPEVGTIIVMQDITYVKRLEQEQSDMVRTLSHDLKSPLTSIKGWTHLARQGKQHPERPIDYYERIEESVNRMLSMIANLLDTLTVIDISQTTVEQGPCEFQDIVEKAIGDLKGAALGKSIAIEYQITGAPYTIKGDARRLYHMALNLLDNAVKYSPGETTVKVSLRYGAGDIVLQVDDAGPGIPEDDLPRIFDRYFRSTAQVGTPGVGIGLSVVRSAARVHGGDVTARNLETGGASFVVLLPASLRYKTGDLLKGKLAEAAPEPPSAPAPPAATA